MAAIAAPSSAHLRDADAMDFMIQNVCLGQQGEVLPISPLDPSCQRQRDLRSNENLPYHKNDWPGYHQAANYPKGMQRGDSFPIAMSVPGRFAFHTFDWGNGARRFGIYDGAKGDGGSLVTVADGFVGSAMTVDQAGGVQLFVDAKSCRSKVTINSLIGWRYAPVDIGDGKSGTALDRLRRVSALNESCPERYANAITAWRFQQLPVMVATGKVGTRTFLTLVSEHYSGRNLEDAPNMERMYFSRELGRTRWERWQNLSWGDRGNDAALSAQLAEDGRCEGGAGKPDHPGQWVMVRCHEWTNIVPADRPGGDSDMDWLRSLATATQAEPLQYLRAPN